MLIGVFLYIMMKWTGGYMLPELFSIGPVTIYSYGLMIAIGVLAAIGLGEHLAKKTGLAEDGFMTSLGVYSVIGGFLGAKILYWITILPELMRDPSHFLDLANGFVVYGGLIGGILTAWIYCRWKKTDFLKAFDLAVPLIALAQGFGRIGCFLAGCCYGEETHSVFGVVFHNSPYAPSDVRLIPTQLISSGLDFLNFLFLYLLFRRQSRKDTAEQKKGTVGCMYIITYSVGRFILEFFRGDLERGAVGVLSTSQFISVFTVIAGIVLFVVCNRKKTASGEVED